MLKPNHALLGLLALATLLTAYNMNGAELQTWDEARRGINALRMLQEGDYFNYRFLDQTDSFNTKPPLFTWLLAVSFKVFGVSLFSLRLPSLIALMLFATMTFKFIAYWKGTRIAVFTLLILLLCNGLIGFHVARSGDTDMMFVFFLTAGLLSFFRFFNNRWKWSLPISICWLALAFLTKGVAVALVIPALLVYGFLRRDILWEKRQYVVLSMGIGIFTALAIWLICTSFGTKTNYAEGYDNLWEAMFFTDGVTRFSDHNFEQGYQWGYLPSTLDIRFSPWIYLLYAGALFATIRGKGEIRAFLDKDEFLLFSLLNCLSVAGLLMLSQNKHQWYITPMLLFLAYPTALVVRKTVGWDRRFLFVFIAITVFLFGAKLLRAHRSDDEVAASIQVHRFFLQTTKAVFVSEQTPQNLLFYLYLANPDIKLVTQADAETVSLVRGECDNSMVGYCIIPPEQY